MVVLLFVLLSLSLSLSLSLLFLLLLTACFWLFVVCCVLCCCLFLVRRVSFVCRFVFDVRCLFRLMLVAGLSSVNVVGRCIG